MTLEAPSIEECYALARVDFSAYLPLVHETDMDWVAEGRMIPASHMEPIVAKYQLVSDIVLRQIPNWQKWARSLRRHTSVVAPPGSAKTTLLQGFHEWLLGRASLAWGEGWADKFHLAHVAAAEDRACQLSYAVKKTITESDDYHAIFPGVKPNKDEKWSDSEWRVLGCNSITPTFQAKGRHGQFLGPRLNFMSMDDLLKQEEVEGEVQATKRELEALIRWIRRTAMSRVDTPGACAWMNHTRWVEEDPPGWAERRGWDVILVRALDENEQSYWPERFATDELLLMREREPEDFELQYMGEPLPTMGLTFKAEYFMDRFDALPLTRGQDGSERFMLVSSWDTAGTTDARSDYTADWTAAVNMQTRDVYLLNLYHDKLEFYDVLDAIRGQQAYFPCHLILIEDKATGQPAAQVLRREGLPVIPRKVVGQGRSKETLHDVIRQIKPMLYEKRVHLPTESFAMARGLSWLPLAERQILSYEVGRPGHDDIVRALIQLLYWVVEGDWHGLFAPREAQYTRWGESREQRVLL